MRQDYKTCVVLRFIAIAFLDEAFAEYDSPNELFSQRNSTANEVEITLKSSILRTPVLRQTMLHSSKVSPTRSYTYGSLLSQVQRIVKAAGFPQRFTLYNIRRGVLNTLFRGKYTTN